MNKKLSRRDFLKLAGITSTGLALSACGVKATEIPTATFVSPTNTATPTLTPAPTSTPNFENLTKVINEQIDKIVRAYQLVDSQKEILANSIETIEVEGKHFWLISSNLLNTHDKKLAELLGDIPVAIQRDFEKWDSPYIKEVSNIPIGAQFSQQGNGSAEVLGNNFNFFIIASDWGMSSFGDVKELHRTGVETKRTIFDYITIVDDKNVVLNQDPSLYSWADYTDYQVNEALKYIQNDNKKMDKGNQNRRLVMLPVVYPSGQTPKDFEKLTKEQAISFLKQYVALIVNHYKKYFFAYVGVTEFELGNDVLIRQVGIEYIDVVYQAIRDADQSAVTILENADNHVPNGLMTEATRKMAQHLKEKDLVDYIAAECHIDLFPGSPHDETYDEIFQTFKNYPLPTFPSSIDINTSSYKNKPDKFIIQAQKAQTVLQASIDAGAPYISFWGDFPDERSWIETMMGEADADATLWATGWIEKPMYFEVLRTLFRNYAKIGTGS